MFINILLTITVVVYLFGLINPFWLKLTLNNRFMGILLAIHLVLLPLFLIPILSALFVDTTIYYAGLYTQPLVFWGFLISGFLYFAFAFRTAQNIIIMIYTFIFQYVWLLIIIIGVIIPFAGILVLFSFKPFAAPHGKTVYEEKTFRIDEHGTGLLLAPRYKKFYYLVSKKGLYETKTSFAVYSEVEGMPTVTSAKVNITDNDSVLVTMNFVEDIRINIDSTSKTTMQKIALE